MSGVRLATILISPFQYIPSAQRLIFHSRIRIVLETHMGAISAIPLRRRGEGTAIFRKLIETATKNPYVTPTAKSNLDANLETSFSRTRTEPVVQPGGFSPHPIPSLEGSGVHYLIITDEAMLNAFEVLADWKTSKGIPAVVRTVTWIKSNYAQGLDDAETIRNFIKEAYQKWGTTYVLLGADVQTIPVRRAWTLTWVESFGYIPTDLYYAALDGNWNANGNTVWGEVDDEVDLFPDVFIGRAPVSTAEQASLFVSKIIAYEQGGQEDDYRDKMLYIGENLWGYNDGEYFCEKVDSVAPPMVDTKIYQNRVGGEWNRETILGEFNTGHNFIYSQNHSNAYQLNQMIIHRNDLDQLTNGPKYSIWYMVGCQANNLELDGISKHFMLAPDGGGVAYIGSTGQDWPYLTIDVAIPFFSELSGCGYNNIAPLLQQSRMVLLPYATNGGPSRAMYMSYTLLGDPELPLSKVKDDGYGRQILADHPQSIQIGTTNVSVTNVREPSVEVPGASRILVGAKVTLFKGGEVLASDTANGEGSATFTMLHPHTVGAMSVVVTSPNHLAYVSSISVGGTDFPHGYYVSSRVDDDNIGSSHGNGDGIVNPGETIELTLFLANSGNMDAEDVKIKASSASPYVDLLVKDASMRRLPSGNIPTPTEENIVFGVASSCPDRQMLMFHLEMQSGNGLENSDDFVLEAKSPQLLHTTTGLYTLAGIPIRWGEAPEGEYDLRLNIQNIGAGTINGISSYFEDNTGELRIYEPVLSLGSFFPGEEKTAIYRCYYSRHAARVGKPPANLNSFPSSASFVQSSLLRLYDDSGVILDHSFRRADVPAPQGFSHEPHSSSIALMWEPIPEIGGYNIYRDGQKINARLVSSGPMYDDMDVELNSSYQYAVRAVDSESNESLPSESYRAWTQIPANQGWPRQTNNWVIGSPAAADVDDDGRLEIFATNRSGRIHGWRWDGSPLGNSPDDLLVDLGPANEIWSQPVIADLDNDGVKEMVVTTRGNWENQNGRLYVWSVDRNGEMILWNGFPVQFDFRILARAAVGDLNGDARSEIGVLTEESDGVRRGGLFVLDLEGDFIEGFGEHEFPDKPYSSYAEPVIGDINGDRANEIVIGAHDLERSQKFYVFNGKGELVQGWPIEAPKEMQIHYNPVVSDVDGDGTADIVAVAHNYEQVTGNNGILFVFRGDGSAMHGWEEGKAVPLNGFLLSSPTVTHLTEGRGEVFLNTSVGPVGWYFDGTEIPMWALSSGHPNVSFPSGASILASRIDDQGVSIIVPATKKLYAYHFMDTTHVIGWPVTTTDDDYFSPCATDVDEDGSEDILLGSNDGRVYCWRSNSLAARTTKLLTSGNGKNNSTPISFALVQNYPNPFNPVTAIRYQLPKDVRAILKVYDILGREIAALVNEFKKAGYYETSFDATRLASGVYFYRLQAGSFVQVRKMLLAK
jgi:hypothetical protein